MPPAHAGRCSTCGPISRRRSRTSSRRRPARHREKRFASTGQMIAALSDAIGMGSDRRSQPSRPRSRASFAPGCWRRWPPPRRCCWSFPRARAVLTPRVVGRPPVAGAQEDYRRAHDLLAHYYRPQALETAIPLLEKIVAQDATIRPRVRGPRAAPTFCSSPSSATRSTSNRRANPSLRALALAPDLASAHVTLGALYTRTAQNDLASHELEEALRLDKFNAEAYGALADLYELKAARNWWNPHLMKAVSLAPDDWGLVQQLGEHYLDRRQVGPGGRAVPPRGRPDARQSSRPQQSGSGVPRTGQARGIRRRLPEGDRPRTDVSSLQESGHGAGRSRKIPGGVPDVGARRSRCDRPNIGRGDSSHPSI